MGTYWKRWIGLVIFAVVLVGAFLRLGDWQLERREQKQQRNDVLVSQQQAPVATFEEVFGDVVTADDAFRRVRVQGTFDPDHQLQVRYRTNEGVSGYEVVVPLHTNTGQWVLVERGSAPRPNSGPLPDPASIPAPPTGVVTVEGYVLPAEPGPEDAVRPEGGSVRLVDPAAIGAWADLPLVDGYLSTTSMTPSQDGGLVPVALPEMSEGPHMAYAVQWFSFAVIGVVGTFILIGKDAREMLTHRRRRPGSEDPGPAGPEDSTATADRAAGADAAGR